jgi:hypothetical protein
MDALGEQLNMDIQFTKELWFNQYHKAKREQKRYRSGRWER